jgi:hypothetical protein
MQYRTVVLFFCLLVGTPLFSQAYGDRGWGFDTQKYDARFPDMWHWAQAGVQCGIPNEDAFPVVDTLVAGADLQEAIDRAAEQGGGVVLLKAGVYPFHETLYLRDSVILRGKDRGGVVLSNQLRGPFYSSPFDNVAGIRFQHVRWAGLENLTVDYHAVDFLPVDYAYFDYPWQKQTFKNDLEGDRQLYVTHVAFDNAQNAWIRNCQVLNSGTDPILVLESEHISITQTRIEGAYNKGGRGNGYFNIEQNSRYVLVAADTVRAIRHLAIQSGAKYNVMIGNCFEVDVNFHNGDGGHNLVEGNIIRIPEWHSWHCFSRGVPKHHRPPGPGNMLFNNYTQYKTRIPGKRDRITEYGDSIIYTSITPADTVEAWGQPQVVHDYGPLDLERMAHRHQLYQMNPAWDDRKPVLPSAVAPPQSQTLYPVTYRGAGESCW